MTMHARSATCALFVLLSAMTGEGVLEQQQPNAERSIPVYGVGATSCGEWLDARRGEKENTLDVRSQQFEDWLGGFLTGYGYFFDRAHPGIWKTDVAGMQAFIDQFCEKNPTRVFLAAATAFVVDQGGRLPGRK